MTVGILETINEKERGQEKDMKKKEELGNHEMNKLLVSFISAGRGSVRISVKKCVF